jgi:hypothetical protein
MAEFQKKPLQILDRLYGFVGGLRGARSVDLSSDITLVHDVARQAEVNGLGGFSGNLLWQGEYTRVGASDEVNLERIADVEPALGVGTEEYELWIMEAHAWAASGANFTNMTLSVGRDTGSCPIGVTQWAVRVGTQQAELQAIAQWYALTTVEDSGGNGRSVLSTNLPKILIGANVFPQVFQPVRVPIGGFVQWLLGSSGAFTFHYTVRMWVGPLGARPPGLS